MNRNLTLLVSVREVSGLPLERQAVVRLSTPLGGQNSMAITKDGSTATFPNIKGGDYEIDVEAVGYKSVRERANVIGVAAYTVYIYLSPEGAPETTAPIDNRPVMTPKLQKEIERSLIAMRDKKYGEAREHLAKAGKLSPSNSDVEYLMGAVDYLEKNLDAAAEHFQKVLTLAPNHERTLVAYGQLEMERKQPDQAVKLLESAALNNSKNAQARLLLASCYFSLRQFAKARTTALEAGEIDKGKAPTSRMIAAKAYLMENDLGRAKTILASLVQDYPADKNVAEAKQLLERIEKASAVAMPEVKEVATPVSQPSVDVERVWAPPDTDEKPPSVAPGVACSATDLVSQAQVHAEKTLANFERFGATEKIDHQEIDGSGSAGQTKTREFTYVILVQRPRSDRYYIDERRDGGGATSSFPTALATRGLVSIGINIFHPDFSDDFNFSCEGLGRWAGHPAWQLRFEQKKTVPSRIRSWNYDGRIFPVALKGRVWLSPNTFDLLHLETDLREPVKDLQLNREHLKIDYGPVAFKQHKDELWLPKMAEMYFSFLGRRYHHTHTLSDYFLFDVDTTTKISAPRNSDPPPN